MRRSHLIAAALIALAGVPVGARASTTVRCAACAGELSVNYQLQAGGTSAAALARATTCLGSVADQFPLGPQTLRGIRSFFEVTGEYPRISGDRSFTRDGQTYRLDGDRRAYLEAEMDLIGDAVETATGVSWPLGASDCLTHAQNLARHLRETLPSEHYAVEVVNSFHGVDSNALIDFNAIVPMANHYLVRVVSRRSGESFVADAYLVNSVQLESDMAVNRSTVTLNPYEACFFDKLIPHAALAFAPTYNGIIAVEARNAAGACHSGGSEYTME